MTLLEELMLIWVTGGSIITGSLVVLKVIEDRIEKDERQKRMDRQRFERSIQAILDAETLEEKVFRGNPENDDKPFIKKEGNS